MVRLKECFLIFFHMKRTISGPNLSGNGQRLEQKLNEWVKVRCDMRSCGVGRIGGEKKIYAMPPNIGTTTRKVGENETWWTEMLIQVMLCFGSQVICNMTMEVVTVSRCPHRATKISLKIPAWRTWTHHRRKDFAAWKVRPWGEQVKCWVSVFVSEQPNH